MNVKGLLIIVTLGKIFEQTVKVQYKTLYRWTQETFKNSLNEKKKKNDSLTHSKNYKTYILRIV